MKIERLLILLPLFVLTSCTWDLNSSSNSANISSSDSTNISSDSVSISSDSISVSSEISSDSSSDSPSEILVSDQEKAIQDMLISMGETPVFGNDGNYDYDCRHTELKILCPEGVRVQVSVMAPKYSKRVSKKRLI